MTWEQELQRVGDFYPGSSKRIPPQTPSPSEAPVVERPEPSEPPWTSSPRKLEVDLGVYYEFFTMRHLSLAVNRSQQALRLWENQRILPVPIRSPTPVAQMRHRLYSRPLIEGLHDIAVSCGFFNDAPPKVTATQFKPLALKLFSRLSAEHLYGAREISA